MRATGRVRFAACNASGRRIRGEWQEGTARIVPEEARRAQALVALQRMDGWQLSLAILVYRLRGSYDERVERDNFNTYEVTRMAAAPRENPRAHHPG